MTIYAGCSVHNGAKVKKDLGRIEKGKKKEAGESRNRLQLFAFMLL